MSNPIVKLFGGLVLFFIFVFFIWFFVAYMSYGSLQYVHLDVQSTFNQLNLIANNKFISGDTLAKTFKSFRDNMNVIYENGMITKIGQEVGLFPKGGVTYALGMLISLLDPLQNIAYVVIGGGYIIVIVLEIVLVLFNGIVGLYEFLFNPKFIVVENYQAVLEKAKNLFGFAFQGLQLF